MDLDSFIKKLPTLYENLESSDIPKDTTFVELKQHVEGMSTPNVLQLLNAACRFLGENEIYVEVGSWKGLTITGASLGQNYGEYISIENYSQFGGPKEEFDQNIAQHPNAARIRQIEGDFRAVLSCHDHLNKQVGVYLYDGLHDYASQYDGLELAIPHLAEHALLIVDDARSHIVQQADNDFIALHPGCRLLFRLLGNGPYTNWWNGIDVIEWRRENRNSRTVSQSRHLPVLWRHFRSPAQYQWMLFRNHWPLERMVLYLCRPWYFLPIVWRKRVKRLVGRITPKA